MFKNIFSGVDLHNFDNTPAQFASSGSKTDFRAYYALQLLKSVSEYIEDK